MSSRCRLTVVATVIWAAFALPAVACGGNEGLSGGSAGDSADSRSEMKPSIVATTSIWADVVANLACDGLADVRSLIPTGADPHAFEPSLADRGQLQNAALVVVNGAGLEEGIEDVIDSLRSSGVAVFSISNHIDTIDYSSNDLPLAELADSDESASGYEHESTVHDDETADPHFWFDPVRVAALLPDLAVQLTQAALLDAGAVSSCLSDYRAELVALDVEIAASVESLDAADRMLATNHEALGYFADRYDFEVVGTVIAGSSSLAETNPARLEELAQLIEASGVPAIFAETQHSSDDLEALANRVGEIEVVPLFTESLGEPGSGADTYIGFMHTNVQRMIDALN